jgi:ribosomal protein S18 acetylase RimI-like enzyme
MDYTIRRAKREDCPEILELVRELAVYERAPDEVTVTLQHFEDSGCGGRPVWWAFVACAPLNQSAEEEATTEQNLSGAVVQDPLLATILPSASQAGEESTIVVPGPTSSLALTQGMQLEESIEPVLPEPVQQAMPLMPEKLPCEKVIGFALYYIRYSTWKGQRMYLEDILVHEPFRGKGVGTALMDALIAAAKAEGLGGISWQVLEWNKPAIKFYERYQARFDHEWTNVAIDV